MSIEIGANLMAIRKRNAHLLRHQHFRLKYIYIYINIVCKRYVKMYKVQTFALKISNPEYVLVIYTLMAPIFGGLLKRPQEVLHAATFAINSAIAQEVLQGVEDILV